MNLEIFGSCHIVVFTSAILCEL